MISGKQVCQQAALKILRWYLLQKCTLLWCVWIWKYFFPPGRKHLVVKYSVFYLFIQCYVFLINCGLSLVFIYVSGRFSPAFNPVIFTVSSSDVQCEICLPKLVLAFLRVRSCSCSSSRQQQWEPQQKTCKTFFSYTQFMCFQPLSYFGWGPYSPPSSALWAEGAETLRKKYTGIFLQVWQKNSVCCWGKSQGTTWAELSVQLPDLFF